MRWFSQSLRNKILILASLVSLMVALAAGYGFWTSWSNLQRFEELAQIDLMQEREVQGMVIDFKTQVQEWKNTLLRGQDPAQLEKYWGAFTKLEQQIQTTGNALVEDLDKSNDQDHATAREQLQQFLAAHKQMSESYRNGLETFKANHFDVYAGDAAVKGVDRKPTETLEQAATIIGKHSTAMMQESIDNTRSGIKTSLLLMAITMAGSAFFFMLLLSSIIIAPSQRLVSEMALLAEGNFSSKIESNSSDEFGKLAQSAQHIQHQLAQLFTELHNLSDKVLETAQEMSLQAEKAETAVNTQSSQTQLIANIAEMMATDLTEIDQHASSVQSSSENANRETTAGQEIVNRSVDAINKLAREISDSTVVIQRLEQNGEEIGKVLDVIRGIAEQTNLLALNAAIEAARAGEQGRGFAVVADEVRTLAQRTQDSTREIQCMIERLQAGTHEATKVMEQSSSRGQSSATESAMASNSLDAIALVVTQISDTSMQITTIAQQSHAMASEIHEYNSAISKVTSDSTETAQCLSKQSAELFEQARQLRTMLARYIV